MNTTRIAAVAALGLAIAACGGGETPTAASCAKNWNADANAEQQATLAGAAATDVILDGKYLVGTWPNAEQTVPVTDGFASKPSGKAAVQTNSCLLVMPPSTVGQMAFVEADGTWKFVGAESASKFTTAARREVKGAKAATPDALGKVKLES